MPLRIIYLMLGVGLCVFTSIACKKDCVSECIQTPIFYVHNGGTDTLMLFMQDTTTGAITDTFVYSTYSIVRHDDGTTTFSRQFNENEDLFKGRNLRKFKFIYFTPSIGRYDTLERLNWDEIDIKNSCHRPDGGECKQIANIRVTYKNKEYSITDGVKEKDKLFFN